MSDGASPIRVRAMMAEDVKRVVALARDLDDAPHWPESAYEGFLREGAMPRRVALVAESDEIGIAGFLVLSVVAPEAELESIGVARACQRKGVARRLWNEAAQRMKGQADVTEVHLEVRESNAAARGLYKALGFTDAGRRARYYADPVEDAVLMQVELK